MDKTEIVAILKWFLNPILDWSKVEKKTLWQLEF
jgi:hypothetical protein